MKKKTVETLGVEIGDIVEVTIGGSFFIEEDTNKGFVRSIRKQTNPYGNDTSWYEIVPFGRTYATHTRTSSKDSFELSILDYGPRGKWIKVDG